MIEENKLKAKELQPHCQWACISLIDECFAKGFKFRITEAYRSQSRQNRLFEQGRSTPGNIVTWTLNSMHTKRLAIDIFPINCSFSDIEEIAHKYNIFNPIRGDRGHFQMDKVPSYPIVLSVEAKIKSLNRGIKRTVDPVKRMLQNQLKRLLKRK